jgi:NAD(P)-dependent dehydrogenase (short-subunit alcohol dehydrogenase family)
LITGTGGGQGQAAQALFAREGARIVGCDIQKGAAERNAAAVRENGHDVRVYTVDLTDPDAATNWIDEAAGGLGG